MSVYSIEDTTLTGIADAIREKTNGTDNIDVDGMSDLIRGITTGAELSIIVTADSGATVTATKGSLSASAVSVNGTATVKVPEAGTWSVVATLDGQTSSAVSVEVIASCEIGMSFFDPVFANNSWSDIIAACESGSVPETWVVGNSKAMTINGKDYQIDIIGKNHDDYADGSGKAPLTFQMHDCYDNIYGMNSTNTNVGGWTDCAMRTTRLPAIFALMPSDVQNGIKEVNKLTTAGNKSSVVNTTADKLFLLSEIEVFGTVSLSLPGEGKQYDYYAAGNSKVKKRGTAANAWCERSPHKNTTGYYCNVTAAGVTNYSVAVALLGVAFAFCF